MSTLLQVRNQIMMRAMRLAQVSSDMQVMTDQKIIQAGEALSCLLRSWQEKKINLWAEDWRTFTLTASSNVTSGGKYYRCIRGHQSGVTDQPGTGADWTTYWYQDDTATTSATAWAVSTDYTCIAEISTTDAYDVISGFIRDGENDYNMTVTDQIEYFKFHDIQTPQTPFMLWFDRKNNKIHLTAIPDKATYVLHVLIIRELVDLIIDGQQPDIVSSYQDALTYCLAANLADEAGIPLERCQYLRATGERFLAQVMSGPYQDKRKPQGVKSCFPRSYKR